MDDLTLAPGLKLRKVCDAREVHDVLRAEVAERPSLDPEARFGNVLEVCVTVEVCALDVVAEFLVLLDGHGLGPCRVKSWKSTMIESKKLVLHGPNKGELGNADALTP